MSNDKDRSEFEAATWAYYQGLKAKGWKHPEEGDSNAPESLFWREGDGRYGIRQIEAAWQGWRMKCDAIRCAAEGDAEFHQLGCLKGMLEDDEGARHSCTCGAKTSPTRDQLFTALNEVAELVGDCEEWAITEDPQVVVGMVKDYMAGVALSKAQPKGTALARLDWGSMCEAFSRVIEAHAGKCSPFHNPVNADAMLALRELRFAAPTIKALADQPRQSPLTPQQIDAIYRALPTPVQHWQFARAIEHAHGIGDALGMAETAQARSQAPAPGAEAVAEVVERCMDGGSRESKVEYYLDVAPLRGAKLPPIGTKLYAAAQAPAVAHEHSAVMQQALDALESALSTCRNRVYADAEEKRPGPHAVKVLRKVEAAIPALKTALCDVPVQHKGTLTDEQRIQIRASALTIDDALDMAEQVLFASPDGYTFQWLGPDAYGNGLVDQIADNVEKIKLDWGDQVKPGRGRIVALKIIGEVK